MEKLITCKFYCPQCSKEQIEKHYLDMDGKELTHRCSCCDHFFIIQLHFEVKTTVDVYVLKHIENHENNH